MIPQDTAQNTAIFRSMVISISAGRIALYANTALCEYLDLPVEQIVGRDLAELSALASSEISEFLLNPHATSLPNRLLADSEGRVFELKTATRQGITDIIFDEISAAASLEHFLAPVSSIPFDQLGEDELRTVRIPDLRFISCCAARMPSASTLAGKIPPLEHRVLTGVFLEETSEALLAHGCTLLPPRGSLTSGFAGAPRYHADHSHRALEAAFEQVCRIERIRANFSSDRRELSPVAIGLASGNAIVGGFGSGRTAVYLAEGECVDTAERLSHIASPGEILVSRTTLDHLLSNLPPDWHTAESTSDDEPDLSPYISHAGSVIPLENPPRLLLAGPGVDHDPALAFYRFEEVWRLDAGNAPPVPVFRAIRTADAAAPRSAEETVLESGFVTRLGKYRLAEVIGSGGMGRVWKAQDAYGNTVAIKTLHASGADSPDSIKRFRREAEIMSRIPHRNICRIFETGEHDGTHFLVMELVEGLTLSDILHADAASTASRSRKSSDLPSLIAAVRKNRSSIHKKNPDSASSDSHASETPDTSPGDTPKIGHILPVDQAIGLMERVCEAVEFAHQHGVLHRDLKPGNILLRTDGDPLVADFGLAKLSGDTDPAKSASLSLSGHVLGTVENMAPEQAESSKSVDSRADVYALGTILYQMCTGRKHFTATGNFIADIQSLQTHEPLRPRAINPSLDPDLEVIILKCLRTSPDERYRSVSALLADLQRFRRGEPIAARPVTVLDLTRKILRRNRAASLVAGVALLLILLLVTGSIWSLSHQLANAEAARQQAEQSRLLAEEKSEEARNLAKTAADNAERAQKLYAEANAAKEDALRKDKETAAERRKREEGEAEAASIQAELSKNLELIKQELAAGPQLLGKALTAVLLQPFTADVIQNGRKEGTGGLPAGTEMQVLEESDKRVRVDTKFGPNWIDKFLVDIKREAPAPAPAPAAQPATLTADLTTGDSPPKARVPDAGILYQATGNNGANAVFLITQLDPERMVYEWRALSADSPKGTGVIDRKKGDAIVEAGTVKVGWKNTPPLRLTYRPDKGLLQRVDPISLTGTPWAADLIELAATIQKNQPSRPEPEDSEDPPPVTTTPEITHTTTPLAAEPLPDVFELADAGDPVAQAELAYRHLHGRGTRIDYEQAAKWFTASINNSEPHPSLPGSHWELGRMHESGKGFIKDIAKAIDHYRQAAEFKHLQSLQRLRALSEEGHPAALQALRRLATPAWSLTLLDKPVHIGDNDKPEFINPKPAGTEYRTTFTLDSRPDSDLQATIQISEMVPKFQSAFLAGRYQTKLFVNNTEIEILNHRIEGRKDTKEIATITVPIPHRHLLPGRNSFAIRSGADGKNHDDFELHSIILSLQTDAADSSNPPPVNPPPATTSSPAESSLDITLRGTPVPVTRLGNGPVGIVLFGPTGSAQIIRDLLASQDSFAPLLPDKASLFLWSYPRSAPFDQIDPAITAYMQGDSKKLRPDLSGIASEVLAQLREKTGLTRWLLVGNSLGAGLLIWDFEKLAADPATSFLLISPTETFMPPPNKLPTLQRTTLLAAKVPKSKPPEIGDDPFLKGIAARQWTATHLTNDIVDKLPGFARGHKILGGAITPTLLTRLLQIQLGQAPPAILTKP